MFHELSDDFRTYSLSGAHEPALMIERGDTVRLKTRDCFDGQVQLCDDPAALSARNREWANPATGPIYVNGAEPGYTLVCKIDELQIAPQGLMSGAKKDGADRILRAVDVTSGVARFGQFELPLNPMIGTIGVAPAEGEVSTVIPGKHGGNMDNIEVRPGATVYFPVAHEGGLFGCGDVHAIQGDGELCGMGIEVASEVTATFEVIEHEVCPWPVVETDGIYSIVTAGEDLDQAAKLAVASAWDFLMKYGDVPESEAPCLLSMVGNMTVCQIVNPMLGVRLSIPKYLVTRTL